MVYKLCLWHESGYGQHSTDVIKACLWICYKIFIADHEAARKRANVVQHDGIRGMPVQQSLCNRPFAPFFCGERNSNRMPDDEDKTGVRQELAKKARPDQIRRGFLQQDLFFQIVISAPLLQQCIPAVGTDQFGGFGQMSCGIKREVACATVCMSCWINRLQMLALISWGAGVMEAAGQRVLAQHLMQNSCAAAVQSADEQEVLVIHERCLLQRAASVTSLV